MNIIAALEGAVAIGVALGEFIGAVADMSVDFVEQASGQTLRWQKRVPYTPIPSALSGCRRIKEFRSIRICKSSFLNTATPVCSRAHVL
jgi:hypothetical protein